MNRVKVAVVAVAVWGLLAGGIAGPALAAEGGHVKEVIKHAKEGIAHEKEAIKHLEEAIQGSDNAHAKEALEHAKESMKHAEESLAHAEEANHSHPAKRSKHTPYGLTELRLAWKGLLSSVLNVSLSEHDESSLLV